MDPWRRHREGPHAERAGIASVLAAVILLVPATAASESAGPDSVASDRSDRLLVLEWLDRSGVPWSAFEGTRHRLGRIFAPAGIALAWEAPAANAVAAGADSPSRGVTVVLMSGARRSLLLGEAMVRPSGRARVWIYPGEVAATLGLSHRNPVGWSAAERESFSGALAVVIAHELIHLLTGQGHDDSRLMSAHLRRSDLLDRSLAADPVPFGPSPLTVAAPALASAGR